MAQSSSSSSSSSSSQQSSQQSVKSELNKEVFRLVENLYDAASSALSASVAGKISDKGIETPLGVLGLSQVEKGEDILWKIYDILNKEDSDQDNDDIGGIGGSSSSGFNNNNSSGNLKDLSGQFYTVIPHRLGRQKSAVTSSIISNLIKWEEKMELIQLMKDLIHVTASQSSNIPRHEIDVKYAALRCEISHLSHSSQLYQSISDYVERSQASSHPETVYVKNVFALSRPNERENFTNHINPKHLLFHGSRISNWVGLLSRGILMPKVVVARGGKRTDVGMLGAGIYFGDRASTAAQYCSPYEKSGKRYMLLCRVAIGDHYDLSKITTSLTKAPSGYQSVHGVRRTSTRSSDFKDDEWVVYNVDQQKQEYLVEFTTEKHSPDLIETNPLHLQQPESPMQNLFQQNSLTQHSSSSSSSSSSSQSSSQLNQDKLLLNQFNNNIQSPIRTKIPILNASDNISIVKPKNFTVDNQDYEFAPGVEEEEILTKPNPYISTTLSTPYISTKISSSPTISSSSSSSEASGYSQVSNSSLNDNNNNNNSEGDDDDDKIKSREDHLRELFASDRTNYEINDPYVDLINVFRERSTFKSSTLSQEQTTNYKKIAERVSKCVEKPQVGEYSVIEKDQFENRWSETTSDVLKGMDWSNVFAAGGAILETIRTKKSTKFPSSDIDLFLYDLSQEQATEKVKSIYNCVLKNLKSKGVIGNNIEPIVRTKHAITIITPYPIKHIQIICRIYKSPAEVLLGFDVDSCCFGYNGDNVYALSRSRRSINKQINIIDLSRRSLSYEHRLWKYAKRGFTILDKHYDSKRVDNGFFTLERKSTGLGRLLLLEWKYAQKAIDEINSKSESTTSPKIIHSSKSPANLFSSNSAMKDKIEEIKSVGGEESDYSDVLIPWSQNWNPFRILRSLTTKDKCVWFARKHKNPNKQNPKGHLILVGLNAVLTGVNAWIKSSNTNNNNNNNNSKLSTSSSSSSAGNIDQSNLVSGKLEFVTKNPGSQGKLLTGSFHPVTDSAQSWTLEAYKDYGGTIGGTVPIYKPPPKPVASVTWGNKKSFSSGSKPPRFSFKSTKKPTHFNFGFGNKKAPMKKSSGFNFGGSKKVQKKKLKKQTARKKAMPKKKFVKKKIATKPAVRSKPAIPSWSGATGNNTPSFNWGSAQQQQQQQQQQATNFSQFGFGGVPQQQQATNFSVAQSQFGFGGVPQQQQQQQQQQQVPQSTFHAQQQLTQMFSTPQTPSSSVSKLLLLVSMLCKGGKITQEQRNQLKKKIIENDPNMICALEVFQIEQDFDELVDTFIRILNL